jgi:hypothetical protein
MITKRQAIEFIQHRLSGGDTPEDLRRLYPRSIIARVINYALSDAVTRDPYLLEDVAVPYDFAVSSDSKGYYVSLSPQPISGSLAIYSVTDESDSDNRYFVQSKIDASTMEVLRGKNKNGAVFYKNALRFNKKPVGTVTVTMIPNVYQMEDDDPLIIPMQDGFGEMAFFQLCLQALSTQGYQDDLNDSSVDAQNIQRG